MPDRFVQVLPDFLINQIAAGEVVENPASVVKELVENSIDAGARRVAVEIEAGGLGLVRVIDDGCGMSPQDALAAMGRHATSKIRSMEDLMSIATLGFRGEALPSIASVSRFTMRTRLSGDDAGTQVEAVDGQVVSRPCACPVGTCIEVRDLFYNVPARLKFQKAESARSMAVADTVRKA
ncbi:MAG TPA: DNA mismatch repair endonuclease MutL, partial [Myxococcota bacterium]|nr:DNA mismatch repair endonuclease MutL [Myxococcota bacterium]